MGAKMLSRHVVGFLLALLVGASAAAELAPQKSSQGGVTVAATPIDLSAGAKVWTFKIVLDTHSQELSDDLPKISFLADDKGKVSMALGWEGAAPGGHHRSGVLKFDAITPRPDSVELRIARPGEPAPRVFRWRTK